MKIWKAFLAVPMALLATQARAVNWVTFGPDHGLVKIVDEDSIRHGDDGLVYFTGHDAYSSDHANLPDFNQAADCQRRLLFTVGLSGGRKLAEWRDNGDAFTSGSTGDAEFKYVCAKANGARDEPAKVR